jgi:osmotically inducible protein OsmC
MIRDAQAQWKGDLREGAGTMAFGSGAFEGAYSFRSRFADGPGTNPEELIAAAHAGCFSMAFSNMLAQAGHVPKSVRTTARVHLEPVDGKQSITLVELITEGVVPGIGDDEFQRIAAEAKAGCPVSRALAAVQISLEATLVG